MISVLELQQTPVLARQHSAVRVLRLRHPLRAIGLQHPADKQMFTFAERLHGGKQPRACFGLAVAAQHLESPPQPDSPSVERALLLARVIDGQDVGVANRYCRLTLTPKAAAERLVG